MSVGAVSRLRNRTLIGAWSGWLEFCELRQEKREQLAAAVTFWTHRELAAVFDQFRWISLLALRKQDGAFCSLLE
jgi:hypothetical protein